MRLTKTALALGVLALAVLLTTASAPAYTSRLDLYYDLGSPPEPQSPRGENALDIYLPDGIDRADRRPVIVFVHGGGWSIGDKSNNPLDKARLFTNAGYVYATINYRLSPSSGDPALNPGRVRFPEHPHDAGEALGWLDRNIGRFGGDSGRMVLIGHSAGAQIVTLLGTNPKYGRDYGVLPAQVIGVVSLDGIFDIAERADPSSPLFSPGQAGMYWNAFATPDENALDGAWHWGSPLTWAEPRDPEHLLVTQAAAPRRVAAQRELARALGQDQSSVLTVPLDHAGINRNLGSPADTSGETAAVMAFVRRVVKAAAPPRVRLLFRPSRIVRSKTRRRRVTFRFRASQPGAEYQCRFDSPVFRDCEPPRRYRVGAGRHVFAVRAAVPGRRAGPVTRFRFRVIRP
jgi:acetyl esterase/lipase